MGYGGYSQHGGFDEGSHRRSEFARLNVPRPKREVFKTAEVAHVWAQQNQAYGRNAKASVYFKGETIYSYGEHFPMARFVETKAGDKVVLITTEHYGPTTSGHQSSVYYALRGGVTKFNVRYLKPCSATGYGEVHAANFARMQEAFTKSIAFAKTKRATRRDVDALLSLRDSGLAYAKAFLDMRKARMPAMPDDVVLAEMKAQADDQDVVRAARQLIRDDRRAARWKEQAAAGAIARAVYEQEVRDAVPDWRAGKHVRVALYNMPTMLRVVDDGKTVETSHGASFPANHARLAWRIIKRCAMKGETFQTNGRSIHLGSYKIDTIDAKGNITAGCHRITIEEATRCAVLLGLEQNSGA